MLEPVLERCDVPGLDAVEQRVGLHRSPRELPFRVPVLEAEQPAVVHRPLDRVGDVVGDRRRGDLQALLDGVVPERGDDLLARAAQLGLGEVEQVDRRHQRLGLDRQQPRRAVEGVRVGLGVDLDLAARQDLGVDHVGAAAEVDDVEHRDVLAQLLRRHLELVAHLVDGQPATLAAGGDQHRGQGDEAGEALRPDRALAAAPAPVGIALDLRSGRRRRELRRIAAMELGDPVDPLARLLDQLGRPLDAGVPLESERPRDQQSRHGVLGVEDVVAQLAVGAELALDVPRDLVGHPDLGGADRVAELPRGAAGVLARVEVGRALEVVLGLGRVGDLAADPREPEHAHVGALVRVADEVELPALEQQVVGVDLAQRRRVGLHRVVLELDPLAPVDGRVDLRQAGRHVGAAGRRRDAEADRLLQVRAERARPAPGDLLERQPQRLGVGELAVEQGERGVERGALVVGELDRRQVEGLRGERVVLLLGEAVGRLVDREVDAERVELRAVRVEAAGEGVLGHVRVALHVAPDFGGCDRPALGHQVRDQRELPDQLFGVLRQTWSNLRRDRSGRDPPTL